MVRSAVKSAIGIALLFGALLLAFGTPWHPGDPVPVCPPKAPNCLMLQ